jgi:hypothetical protein
MKTLSLREKVFISLVAAAGLFALISLLYPSSSTGTAERSERQAAQLNDFSSKLALQMARNGVLPFEAAAIKKAAEPWKKNPFLKMKRRDQVEKDQTKKTPDAVDAPKLAYSGYLRMGKRILAIIDGLEYEAGERLTDRPTLALQRISSDRIVLVQTDTGAKIVVPMEKDQSPGR